ncbi:helix-hairpin-helix domain-containing protein [Halorubrum ezzemoulense]|uniref:helix-hairpin-helix domain-containing protein n=1 Tax=Halorubrum ezzemoulense TaxID=337243 RepID=UPI0023314E1E|nr:helix-hairpin-helix domain-containing protein [Halorubrum ezzemoulense]MDB9249419.1 helix-hairpin-helix domain-containing protein [Halorubrum ezzemoulense]MDB9257639.1 helix-hairpin-helix domain-containing protein [Halorubrum ezzemoulense]MDB9261998.1 helix-hairpin-helix domain-containing protein [Halorubrum ezzemoulense]MDB9265501.1 helix-hairpin-helix domain-containing protein [Halorubrum ezzemoulense]MDB9268000.1 helix-hairpin-helix domain-containing protein [Halorubrum ezzemoulense]
MSRNDEVATRLEEFADLLEATGVEYKPTAYRRAAENVRDHPAPIEGLAADGEDAVAEIDRVGDAIAAKIVEYVETGEIGELTELREELPVDMAGLTAVEGVGPKTVGSLYDALGISDLDELETAAEAEEIREVSGFGAKTEENILDNIPFAREARERTRLGDARPVADDALAYLADRDAVESVEVCGSIRRWKPTIGDIDLLVASEERDPIVEAFTDWEAADATIEAGTGKASVRADGTRVDLRIVDPDEFGAALQYFTGSRAHNVAVRNRAIDRGRKLNEYGLFDVSDAEGEAADDDAEGEAADGAAADGAEADATRAGERIAGESEDEVYRALDMDPVPPELREDRGEVEAAAEGRLPPLVGPDELRGDLHTHTDWSDGGFSIAEMAAAAEERGYDYHVVTDHATGPGMVGGVGLDESDIEAQAAAVAEAADEVDIPLLHGIEANIDAGGDLSTDDETLAALDLVVASPHAALGQDAEAATERLVRAVEHPHVDVLGHPTGRLINERPGLDPDVEAVAEAASASDTAIEVNANPARLDADGEFVRAAVEAGATIAVNTDAHAPRELDNARYGVHTARRGWARAADVLNARSLDGLRSFLL